MRESDFLKLLNERLAGLPRRCGIVLGVGDDAAILELARSPTCVVTTDMLLDGIDFDLAACGYRAVGRKAINKNLSDLAAMGADPLAAFVSLALPVGITTSEAGELLDGLLEASEAAGCRIAGGDTKRSPAGLVVNVTLIGQLVGTRFLRRSGAAPGDTLFVSGPLGGSILGHHLTFEPRILLGATLAVLECTTAAIDLSDGLSTDLHHLCAASGVGALIDLERIPIADAAREIAAQDGRSPLEHALHDGEDYELLFCVRDRAVCEAYFAELEHFRLTAIGTLRPPEFGCQASVRLPDGSSRNEPLVARGFEHRFDSKERGRAQSIDEDPLR